MCVASIIMLPYVTEVMARENLFSDMTWKPYEYAIVFNYCFPIKIKELFLNCLLGMIYLL